MKIVTETFLNFDTGKDEPVYTIYPWTAEDAEERDYFMSGRIIVRKWEGKPTVTVSSTLDNLSFEQSVGLSVAMEKALKLCWEFDVQPV